MDRRNEDKGKGVGSAGKSSSRKVRRKAGRKGEVGVTVKSEYQKKGGGRNNSRREE